MRRHALVRPRRLWMQSHAIGRSIRCTCLGDGEMTRWNRADFMGVLKDQFLPDWAAEKLAELKGMEQTQSEHQLWVI